MRKLIIRTFAAWLPAAASIVCIYGIMYYVVQQYIRLSANETPLQYATDAVNKLADGLSPSQAISWIPQINMQNSLSPFVIIYDSSGAPICGTAKLNGSYPVPPAGSFAYSRTNRQNRISWQPERGVRNAAIIMPVEILMPDNMKYSGYVLAGQSLSEAEARIAFAGWQICMGIIITLIAAFVVTFIVQSRNQT